MINYTLSRVSKDARRARHQRQTRMEQGAALRSLYRQLGHDRRGAAKFLRVTPRTLLNWEAGATPIPFAVLKLLRLLVRSELPGREWQGWCFNRGTLWTPEGHGFKPADFAWLSLTVRQARMFAVLYRERTSLRRQLEAAKAEAALARLSMEAEFGLQGLAAWSARAGARGARAEHAGQSGREVLVTPPGRLTRETAQSVEGGAA